jgi:uncharacterized membrane protein
VSGATENLSAAEGVTPKTALVFLIFLAAGPPLGSLLLWVATTVLGHIPLPLSVHDVSVHLQMLGIYAVASYIFGGVQALLVAAVAAIVQSMSRMGMLPFLPVLLACLLASAAYPALTIVKSRSLPAWDMLLLVAGLHVGSGILCWVICNTILWPLRRRSSHQAMA